MTASATTLGGRKGYLQGYNAQAVVIRERIIIAPGLTHQANDVHQLVPMIDQALAMVETVMGEEARLRQRVGRAPTGLLRP